MLWPERLASCPAAIRWPMSVMGQKLTRLSAAGAAAKGQYRTCRLFRFYADLVLNDDRESERKRRALTDL